MNPQETNSNTSQSFNQSTNNFINQSVVTPQTEKPKIGKFKASRLLVKESLDVLKKDKELVLFPILSLIVSLIFLAVFFAVLYFVFLQGDIELFLDAESEQLSVMGYVFVFVYYLIMFFITNYFLAGIYTIANGRFNGQDLSFSDGIANANRHITKIFTWSLISATVGMVLRIIADRSKVVGKIVVMVFGAAWSILTFFSLPSLIIGNRSVKESFKESASVIRKTWGETFIVTFGIGLFFYAITLFVFLSMIGILILVPTLGMLVVLSVLFVIYIVFVSIISSALNSIVKLALYKYATTGEVPQCFTPEVIKGAISSSKK